MTSSADKPRVSVIITVHNRTEYLPMALGSALGQRYRQCEFILADDSGAGAAREIAARHSADPRLHYSPNPATLGIVGNLQRAVSQAKGDFISILNDDDIWAPDFLAETVPPLEDDPRRVLSFCDHWVMDAQGEVSAERSNAWSAGFGRLSLGEGEVPGAREFVVVKHGVPIANSSVFRRDAFDWSLLAPEVKGAYDYWISCLLAATGRPIYYVPKRLAYYRMHAAMETHRRSHDKAENLVYMLSCLRRRKWFPELDAYLKAELAYALTVAGREKLAFGRRTEARDLLWRSLRLRFRARVLGKIAASFLPAGVQQRLRPAGDAG